MTHLPIPLPYGFSPLVAINETVTVGQKIAQNTAPQEEVINIPRELRISVRKARKVLKKSPGEAVTQGDIIALHKKFFGMHKEAVISRISGTIVKYERDTGDLYIRTSFINTADHFISPVDGIVTLCDNEKIVIAVEKHVVLATNASEAKGEGEVYFFDSSNSPNQLFLLDSSVNGKIVLTKRVNRESLTKGIALGALGFIGSGIEPGDIEYVRQKHSQVPVLDVNQETLEKLVQWKNKKVYIDGQARSVILLQV